MCLLFLVITLGALGLTCCCCCCLLRRTCGASRNTATRDSLSLVTACNTQAESCCGCSCDCAQNLRRVAREHPIDLYLQPPVTKFRLLDYHLMDRIVRDSNRCAAIALPRQRCVLQMARAFGNGSCLPAALRPD
jgi:hypothetical protein